MSTREESYQCTVETIQDANQQSIHNRYEQLVLKANSLREELHTEIDRMLKDVTKFKAHIQKNLEEYEDLVADDVEEELPPGDEMSETEG